MSNFEHEELKDVSCRLYTIHMSLGSDSCEFKEETEKIRLHALGKATDEFEPTNFVAIWPDNKEKEEFKTFDEMPEGSFVIYKETNDTHEDVHIGVLKDPNNPKISKARETSLGYYENKTTYYRHVWWLTHIAWNEVKSSDKLNNLYNALRFRGSCHEVDDQDCQACKIEIFNLLNKEKLKVEEKAKIVEASKNVIFRGAPRTGKTYLAKQVAAWIVSAGDTDNFDELTERQKEQYSFVQFRSNNDCANIVGAFKAFCDEARRMEYRRDKDYVFVIDDINRGKISKIFGDLLFSIDPEHRGEDGAVLAQYANMRADEDQFKDFYVPENVYIIGTMNDVDGPVENFDPDVLRRFAFVEVKPEDTQSNILYRIEDEERREKTVACMNAINDAIKGTEGLEEYQCLGAVYFKNIERCDGDFKALWDYYLKPTLEKYASEIDDNEFVERCFDAYNKLQRDKRYRFVGLI